MRVASRGIDSYHWQPPFSLFHHNSNLPTLLFRNLVPMMPAQARNPSNTTRQSTRANTHDVTLGPGQNPSIPKRGKDTSRKRKPLLPLGEVIEISSDEESPASIPNPTVTVTNLRRQVKRLKEENTRCKQDLLVAEKDLAMARETVSVMQASLQPEKGKLILEASHIQDQLSCEICTGRLWSPHTLPECGHVFCQSCLQDWFNTTLAQFLAAHPHYDGNNLMRHLQGFPHIPQAVAYQAPQYTCPTCRTAVRNRPVEVFALKALVRTIAAAAGESSPKKPLPVMDTRAGKRGVQTVGPWDGFFPKCV